MPLLSLSIEFNLLRASRSKFPICPHLWSVHAITNGRTAKLKGIKKYFIAGKIGNSNVNAKVNVA